MVSIMFCLKLLLVKNYIQTVFYQDGLRKHFYIIGGCPVSMLPIGGRRGGERHPFPPKKSIG
jgi:hypothetical protein